MSDKRKISEKRRTAEKRVKAGDAPKPLPGLQSPEQFAANMLRAIEAGGQAMARLVEDKDKRNGAFTVGGGLAELGEAVCAHHAVLDERPASLCRRPNEAKPGYDRALGPHL